MPGRRRSNALRITLSAMATALGVIFLYLGTFNTYVLFVCYVLAEISLMLPLSKQYYGGAALAYVACCLLTVLMGALARVWALVPFIVFFGLHPIANALQLRFNINRWLALIVKIVWFDLTCWLTLWLVFDWYSGASALFDVLNKYIWIIIVVGGSIVAFAYDYLMFRFQVLVNNLIQRIDKNA